MNKVLMYHSVGNNEAFFTVKLKDFIWQMEYLKKHHEVVPLHEILFSSTFANRGEHLSAFSAQVSENKISLNEKNKVAITFDDGYLDNFETVLPILKKYNFPFSIFVITDLVGKENTTSNGDILKIMSKENISECISSGLVSIYSHTHSHKSAKEISAQEFLQDAKVGKEEIEKLGGGGEIFCFPKGHLNEEVKKGVENLGFKYALSVNMGDLETSKDNFEINRIAIDSKVGKLKFKIYMSKYFETFLKFKRICKSII